MIENLEGGTISLEHSYAVGPLSTRIGHETLYEGTQDPFDRPVWIHVYDLIEAAPHARLDIAERLRRAAQSVREVESCGLLHVIDHGELDEGLPFLITERCRAPRLDALLTREGTLSLEETAQLIDRLASLLEPVHARGLFHGSITPAWVFLPEEEPSLARLGHTQLGLSWSELEQIDSPLPAHLLAALAPELLPSEAEEEEEERSAPPHGSRAADIYALGVLAYTCLTGAHPKLDGEERGEEALARLLSTPPRPLSELGVEGAFAEAVMRALESEPAARWPSARAMSQALLRGADLMPATTTAATPQKDRKNSDMEGARKEPSKSERAATARATRAAQSDEITSDSRSMLTGVALVLLLATNGLWAITTLSRANTAAGDANVFTHLSIEQGDAPLSISDVSNPGAPPSSLGSAPLELDLPVSATPLRLELTPEGSAPLEIEFEQQRTPPTLRLRVSQASEEGELEPALEPDEAPNDAPGDAPQE